MEKDLEPDPLGNNKQVTEMRTQVLFRNLWGLCTAVTGLCRNAQL